MKKIFFVFLVLAGCSNTAHQETQNEKTGLISSTQMQSQSSENFPINETCYLKEFNEKKFPWRLDDCKNFEEVYQDYQYFEAKFDKASRQLTIKKFIRGDAAGESKFKLLGSSTDGWRLSK